MEVGTILEWLVKPGDAVKRGDIIAVVDTEKATIEVEVFETGIIEEIIVPVGQKVPIGTLLARIRTAGEVLKPHKPSIAAAMHTAAPPPSSGRSSTSPGPSVAPLPPRVTDRAAEENGARVKMATVAPPHLRVSPLAMRTALELKVDLSAVKGTGPHGAITRADVEKASETAKQPLAPAALGAGKPSMPPAEPAKAALSAVEHKATANTEERRAAMRRVIAAAMARSKREIPHYYMGTRIDMSRAMAWLQARNLERAVSERMLYSVLLLKATALAARQIPEMNGFWLEDGFKPSADVHLGVAISLRQGGLIAPAIHGVDKKTLPEIMIGLRDLVGRVRAGTLRSSEVADATLTVTSLGEEGVETVFGIIYPPQVALVGFGKITQQIWAIDGMLGARPTIMASLAADHRASDGHRGGLFLAAIEHLLQEPEKL
jgi:pyruvate dehydrogenase E2 component (dihydrolipoamide acetyltransferase)